MIKALWFITLIYVMLCIPQLSYGQWEEQPEPGTTLDFGGLQNDKASSYTAQAIHAGKHGWVGLQASQIRADGEAKSQDMDARVQIGKDFLNVSLQVFAEGHRSMDTDLTLSTGGYLRKTLQLGKLDITVGGGSLVEREDVRADLGLEATDATVLPYWLAIIAGKYNFNDTVNFNARVIANPEVQLNHWKGTMDFGVDIRVARNAVLKFQSTHQFSTVDGVETDTENTLLLSLSY